MATLSPFSASIRENQTPVSTNDQYSLELSGYAEVDEISEKISVAKRMASPPSDD
jgi:hypothetical protein